MWTRDWKRAQELAWLVATEYARLLMETAQPLDGVHDWLQVRRGGGTRRERARAGRRPWAGAGSATQPPSVGRSECAR